MTPITAGRARPNTDSALAMLASAVCVIVFHVKDGSERVYLGTRDGARIPQDATTGNDRRRDMGGFVPFYAIAKLEGDSWIPVEPGRKAWKSLMPDNLVSITEHKE